MHGDRRVHPSHQVPARGERCLRGWSGLHRTCRTFVFARRSAPLLEPPAACTGQNPRRRRPWLEMVSAAASLPCACLPLRGRAMATWAPHLDAPMPRENYRPASAEAAELRTSAVVVCPWLALLCACAVTSTHAGCMQSSSELPGLLIRPMKHWIHDHCQLIHELVLSLHSRPRAHCCHQLPQQLLHNPCILCLRGLVDRVPSKIKVPACVVFHIKQLCGSS